MPGRYISPYNLDERMKRLDRPGLPEMPCICDPECMCADLCAGDLTQNCLCEENGLFCRVTEGWDIDDLDVPDLEGVKQSNFVDTRHSDGVQPMLAHDMLPNSPTLRLAFQLATMDRAQLKRLGKYFQHAKRPQHKDQTKTSGLQDGSFAVCATQNSSNDGQNPAFQQHQHALKPLTHSAIEVQHDFPRKYVHRETPVMASLHHPVSTVSCYSTFSVVHGSPLANSFQNGQQTKTRLSDVSQKTKKQGLVQKSFSLVKRALSWTPRTSKSFDGEMIDRLIRPSPLKKIS